MDVVFDLRRGMILRHHDFQFELPDEWWVGAGMLNFRPRRNSYLCGSPESNTIDPVTEIAIADIAPVRRLLAAGVFNHNEQALARERVTRLLSGFRTDAKIPPVEYVPSCVGPYRFKLTAGVHRLYCSVAVGFTHIPAVPGFDWESLDH